jgi:uncharacterized protein (TIGR02118 family)
MIKQVSFFKRREDRSPEEFRDYWLNAHADVVRRLNGIVRYVQNHALEPRSGFDGIAEVWFEDIESMRNVVDTPELAAIRSDEENFIDLNTMGTVLTTEYLIKDPEPPSADQKMMALVKGLIVDDPDTFQSEYRDQLGPLVAAVPGIDRYVQAHTRPGIYRTGRTPAYDAVASVWFSEVDALVSSREMEAVRDLERTIIDLEHTRIGMVKEIEIAL